MAYKRLSGVSLNNPKETFQHLRDFLCSLNGIADYSSSGIGWTLHDAVYAVSSTDIRNNDYIIVYSTGEDGNRQLYYRFIYTESGVINVYGYLYWNNSTHTGTQLYSASGAWTNFFNTNNILSIYGDLDAVSLIVKYSSSYYAQFIGWMPDSRRSTTVTTIGSSISAGSNVTVTFSSIPSGWAAGKYVFMYDNANIERVLIGTIAGNDVTFSSIASSYSSGAKFIMEDTYYCTTSNGATWYRRIGNNGTKNDIVNMYNHGGLGVTAGDPLDSYPYPSMKLILFNTTSLISPLKNTLIGVNNFSQESTHTIDGVQYKYFGLSSGMAALFKDA